jgi:aryl-alcohol dehydrogenase-like predicted oxidoreductase
MEYRRLGRAGVKVSSLGVGCNQFGLSMDEKAAERVVHYAIDQGINLFDTSDRYQDGLSEEFLGKALKGRRSEVVLGTKFGAGGGKYTPSKERGPNYGGGSRYYILKAVEASLRRLQTDHIDLYQIHLPDRTTPIEETLRTLDDLVRMGKVRYIGCSNFRAFQVYEAMETSKRLNLESFVTDQEQYNVIERGIEDEMVPCYRTYGLGLLPYFPLAGGLLTGKYRRGQEIPSGSRFDGRQEYMKKSMGEDYLSDRNFDILDKLEAFAREQNHTMGDLAIAWLLSHPWVSSVIAGASKPEQIDANLKGTGWILTPEQMAQLDAVEHKRRLRAV